MTDNNFIYLDYNATTPVPAEIVTVIEGADACLGTASGMAAISTALLALLRPGDVASTIRGTPSCRGRRSPDSRRSPASPDAA